MNRMILLVATLISLVCFCQGGSLFEPIEEGKDTIILFDENKVGYNEFKDAKAGEDYIIQFTKIDLTAITIEVYSTDEIGEGKTPIWKSTPSSEVETSINVEQTTPELTSFFIVFTCPTCQADTSFKMTNEKNFERVLTPDKEFSSKIYSTGTLKFQVAKKAHVYYKFDITPVTGKNYDLTIETTETTPVQCYTQTGLNARTEQFCRNDYSVAVTYRITFKTTYDSSKPDERIKINAITQNIDFKTIVPDQELKFDALNQEIYLKYTENKVSNEDHIFFFNEKPDNKLLIYLYIEPTIEINRVSGEYENPTWTKNTFEKKEDLLITEEKNYDAFYIIVRYTGTATPYNNTITLWSEVDYIDEVNLNEIVDVNKMYSQKKNQYSIKKDEINEIYEFRVFPSKDQRITIGLFEKIEGDTEKQIEIIRNTNETQLLKVTASAYNKADYRIQIEVHTDIGSEGAFMLVIWSYMAPVFKQLLSWKHAAVSIQSNSDDFFSYTSEKIAGNDNILTLEKALKDEADIYIYLDQYSIKKDPILGFQNSVWSTDKKDTDTRQYIINLPQGTPTWDMLYIVFNCKVCRQHAGDPVLDQYDNSFKIINQNEFQALNDGEDYEISIINNQTIFHYEVTKKKRKDFKLHINLGTKNNVKVQVFKRFGDKNPVYEDTSSQSLHYETSENYKEEVIYDITMTINDDGMDGSDHFNIIFNSVNLQVVKIDKANEVIKLDMSTQKRHFYYLILNTYQMSSEGAITLTFNETVADLNSRKFQLYSNVAQIKDTKDLEVNLPHEDNETEYKYRVDNDKHVRMYYRKHVELGPNYTDVVLLLTIVFEESQKLTADLSISPVASTFQLHEGENINLQTIQLQDYIPYLVKLVRNENEPTRNTLIYSEDTVNVYVESFIKGKEVNSYVPYKMFGINQIDKIEQVFMLEFFGPKKTILYQIEVARGKVTQKSVDTFDKPVSLECSKIDETEFVVGEFLKTSELSKYFAYSHYDYGSFLFYFTTFNKLDTSKKSILPGNSLFTGPDTIANPIFILKKVCKSFGASELRFLEKSLANVTIDKTTNSKDLMLEKGLVTLDVKDLTQPNIEIRLVQAADMDDAEVIINLSSRESLKLDKDNKVTRLTGVTDNKIQITNNDKSVVLSLKLGSTEMKKLEFTDNLTALTDENVYFKLEKERTKDYKVELSITFQDTFKFEIAKGKEGFISIPTKNKISELDNKYIYFENPYNKQSDLLQDEFFYLAISLAGKSGTYDLTVTEGSLPTGLPVKSNDLKLQSGELLLNLEMSRDYSKHFLVIYLSQCTNQKYTLRLSYDNKEIDTYSSDKARDVVEFTNLHIPIDIQYDIEDDKNHKFYLSYNYLTDDDTEEVSTEIGRKYEFTYDLKRNKLKWDSDDSSITKYKIFLVNKDDNINIKTECDMLDSNKEVSEIGKDEKEYLLGEKVPGKFIVNILGINDKYLPYYIAFEQQEIDMMSSDSTTVFWVWMGIGIAIIVLVIAGVTFYYLRRKKRLEVSEMEFDKLVN